MDPSTEQQMSNLQITVNERPKIKIKSSKAVPFIDSPIGPGQSN
jgi:hypothetical protein